MLEYAYPVLNLTSRTSVEKLDRVQNAALRHVLGAFQSTPIVILEFRSRMRAAWPQEGGTGNGGYRIYFLWPDGSTTRICGPVGETTHSYECELMAVTECLPVMIRKQQEGDAMPAMAVSFGTLSYFLDRALMQGLGGSGSEGVGGAMLLADYLQKTEGVQTVVQWLPSHIVGPSATR
ncbi:hypothetical protein PoB_000122900 [Plakobranchus ocellatus]|uniref:Uncharacterized protein n=1 Tax=Plakobranchus ocellatus TaxID=259542 RepID=A0AAV3XY84_9GAST|nr:hypothetical protein PoB_000122900 [Plakobranchus ocellatus]